MYFTVFKDDDDDDDDDDDHVSDHLNGCYKTTDIHGCRSGMETLPV